MDGRYATDASHLTLVRVTAPFLGSTSDLTRQQLRARRYTRLSRDVYVLTEAPVDLRARVTAVRLALDDAVPCLTTAALLLRLPADDDGRLHLARRRGAPRSERPGVRVHRLALRPDEVLDLGGVPVTSGPRTFTDLAARLDLETLVSVGDVVVRRWGADAVAEAVSRSRRRPGALLMRQALPLLDPGADSPAETRARLRLHAAGFTALRHRVTVCDEHGGWLGTPDLGDDVARVAVQHEGAVHFRKGEQQRAHDLARDELFREQGWQVVCSTAVDDRRPELLVRKVAAAYRRAAHLWGPQVLPLHLVH